VRGAISLAPPPAGRRVHVASARQCFPRGAQGQFEFFSIFLSRFFFEASCAPGQAQPTASYQVPMETKRARTDAYHFLVVLANHRPLVAALRCTSLDCVLPFASQSHTAFDIGSLHVVLGQTPGFRLVSPSSVDRTFNIVSVDSLELLDEHAHDQRPPPASGDDEAIFWAPLADHCSMSVQSNELVNLLGRFYTELDTLFLPRARDELIRRDWKVITLPSDVLIVPDLNKYLAPKSALVVQFDCATQKSRHIVRLAKEHLRYHPSLRIIFVSCRIVHAHDLMADLDEAFPQGDGTEFSLYSTVRKATDEEDDDEAEETLPHRVVVQLNSINKYARGQPYEIVVLDEVCGMLSFFTIGNRTMRSSKDKRLTLTDHVDIITKLCSGCDKLLLSSAPIVLCCAGHEGTFSQIHSTRLAGTYSRLCCREHLPEYHHSTRSNRIVCVTK
jgi:hypothetical protein